MFGLSFANPLVLTGLAGAGIPIIIHLIHRQRAVVHDFAAIDLILRTQKRLAARLKLYQLLLLLLRVLAVVCVALALARPFLAAAVVGAGERRPTSTVFVVDDSLSMRYRHGGVRLFDAAAAGVRDMVQTMRGEDNAAIVLASRAADAKALSFNRRELLDQAGRMEPTHLSCRPQAALLAACDLLAGSKLPIKRIVLCHDLTAAAWSGVDMAGLSKRLETVDAALTVLSVRPAERMPNAAVVGIELAPHHAEARAIDLTAHLRPPTKRSPCDVYLAGLRMARGFVDPSGDAAVRKDFSLTGAPPGDAQGRVALAADALSEDDVRYFAVASRERLRALLVDGDPGTAAHQSETFYLERALEPRADAGSLIHVRVVPAAGLVGEVLGDFDIVAVCNVGDWPSESVSSLKGYVAAGGHVLVSMGDRVDAEALSQALASLLPCALRLPKSFEAKPLGLDLEALDHPVARAALGRKASDAAAAAFRRIVVCDGELAPGTETVLRYANGLPALLIRPHGRGTLTLFTSTLDRAWTDLPIRTAFVPLVQELARYLSGRTDTDPAAGLRVGQPKRLRLPRHVTRAAVVGPDGRKEDLSLESVEGGKSCVASRTPVPGVYVVKAMSETAAEPEQVAAFVANLDPNESDLSALPAEFFEHHLGVGRVTRLDARPGEANAGRLTARRGELSFGLLVAALTILLLEALVAIRE